ncbi:MAG: hypothetical protein HZY73_08850 [Micropruina sp.]|nr:MAG: hypothetical protein HZY73_08850 [Micropruina sp.]
MGRRFFWFAVGVGVAAFVVLKGREYYRRFTPAGVTQQIDKTTQNVQSWMSDFVETFSEAYHDREAELREALGLDGAPAPVQGTTR